MRHDESESESTPFDDMNSRERRTYRKISLQTERTVCTALDEIAAVAAFALSRFESDAQRWPSVAARIEPLREALEQWPAPVVGRPAARNRGEG